ncbi:MAG: hypothetical protein ACTSPM_08755 [Candidatus Heimdallarchaeota archaeon]
MSGTGRRKSSIMKYVPEERIVLRGFLEAEGVKIAKEHVVILNSDRVENLDQFVEKDDEIIVLPILKGG